MHKSGSNTNLQQHRNQSRRQNHGNGASRQHPSRRIYAPWLRNGPSGKQGHDRRVDDRHGSTGKPRHHGALLTRAWGRSARGWRCNNKCIGRGYEAKEGGKGGELHGCFKDVRASKQKYEAGGAKMGRRVFIYTWRGLIRRVLGDESGCTV